MARLDCHQTNTVVVKLHKYSGYIVVIIGQNMHYISPLAPLTRPSDLLLAQYRQPMASLSTLCRPTVSCCLLDSVNSSMCAVCPGMASLALIEYCSHCGAQWFNISVFLESTSTFNLYTCVEAYLLPS